MCDVVRRENTSQNLFAYFYGLPRFMALLCVWKFILLKRKIETGRGRKQREETFFFGTYRKKMYNILFGKRWKKKKSSGEGKSSFSSLKRRKALRRKIGNRILSSFFRLHENSIESKSSKKRRRVSEWSKNYLKINKLFPFTLSFFFSTSQLSSNSQVLKWQKKI